MSDRAKGRGGISILGQGLNSLLAAYNGTTRLVLPQDYTATLVLGRRARQLQPRVRRRPWWADAFVMPNFGSIERPEQDAVGRLRRGGERTRRVPVRPDRRRPRRRRSALHHGRRRWRGRRHSEQCDHGEHLRLARRRLRLGPLAPALPRRPGRQPLLLARPRHREPGARRDGPLRERLARPHPEQADGEARRGHRVCGRGPGRRRALHGHRSQRRTDVRPQSVPHRSASMPATSPSATSTTRPRRPRSRPPHEPIAPM